MNKEQQDLAWACLPKEARNNILSDYEYHLKRYEAVKRQHSKGVIDALEDLFGKDNLTSDTEPEEMLMVSRSEVQEAYKAVVSDMRRSVLFELFGKKCLSDKKESKPKFHIGQKVRVKGTKQIGTIKEPYSNDVGYRVYFEDGDGGWDKEYSADELEPYIEPESMKEWLDSEEHPKPKFKVGDKVRVNNTRYNKYFGSFGVVKSIEEFIRGTYVYNLENDTSFIETSLEPYTEPETKDNMEEKELNLAELLKGCEGEEFFSISVGKVMFKAIYDFDDTHKIRTIRKDAVGNEYNVNFHSDGRRNKAGLQDLYPSEDLLKKYPLDAKKAWDEWASERKPKYILQAEMRLISLDGRDVEDWEQIEIIGVPDIDLSQAAEAVRETLQKFHEQNAER